MNPMIDARRRSRPSRNDPPLGDVRALASRCVGYLITTRQEAWEAGEEWAVGPDRGKRLAHLGVLKSVYLNQHVHPRQRVEVSALVNVGIFG